MLPAVYALVAYAVIWGTDLGSFPNPTFLRESVAAVGIDAMPVWAAVMLMVLLNAVYGFIRSCANALGEEIGWRGFLTPQLVRTRGFTGASLINIQSYGMGVAAGDFNNDGWVDLYRTGLERATMLRNNGDGTFADVTRQTGTENRGGWGVSAAFVDYDRDGWLDLVFMQRRL